MISESLKKKSCPNCHTKRYYDGRTKECDFCGYTNIPKIVEVENGKNKS